MSSKGVYGALTSNFNSNKAFFIESNIPPFLTNGDKISVPVIINNNPISVNIDLMTPPTFPNQKLSILPSDSKQIKVPAHSAKSVLLDFDARQQAKDKFALKIIAKCSEGYTDSFSK